jgi:flagellar basal-body rod protein FlgC
MSQIDLVPAINISSSGMDAEKLRMEVVANNVANAETTRGPDGNVFRRRQVIFASKLAEAMGDVGAAGQELGGVRVVDVVEDGRPPKTVHRPGHPDADEAGYVKLPNVNPIEEMVDMMTASRAYEANVAAIRISKSMVSKALEIGR